MPAPSARSVAQRLRELLPPDGTPVLNRVLRLMLSKDLGQAIDDGELQLLRVALQDSRP